MAATTRLGYTVYMQQIFDIGFEKHYVFIRKISDFVVCEDVSPACQKVLHIGHNFVSKYFQARGAIKKHLRIFQCIADRHALAMNAERSEFSHAAEAQPAIASTHAVATPTPPNGCHPPKLVQWCVP